MKGLALVQIEKVYAYKFLFMMIKIHSPIIVRISKCTALDIIGCYHRVDEAWLLSLVLVEAFAMDICVALRWSFLDSCGRSSTKRDMIHQSIVLVPVLVCIHMLLLYSHLHILLISNVCRCRRIIKITNIFQ